MKWTQAQRETIETRNKNILVSAAAGSGKTAVLIERIKRLVIEEKTDIDRFLITTFTNAASAEMKERLEKAIREELKKENADRPFLKKQLSLMPRANISTFHTFALEVMQRYFYLTDLEPGFRIGDDTEVSIMKNESADQLFEQRFSEDYDTFKEFLKKYSSDRNDNRIKSNIIALYNEMRSIPGYMNWAESTSELLKADLPSRELGLIAFIEEEVLNGLKLAASFYKNAANVLEDAGIESLYEKALQDHEMLEGFIHRMTGSKAEPDIIAECRAFLTAISFNQMRAKKDEKEEYEKVKEHVSTLRKKGKKTIDDLIKKFFQRTGEEYDSELKALYSDTVYMTGLIRDFETIFRTKKAERNIVDFDDVMHYAIDILQDDMAAAEYRNKFTYIFVDEFQDSNMLQETIIGRIAGRDNLFMVGDVKQSIYKFRLAEPEIFKRKYALYSGEAERDSVKIDLNNNFRSKLKVTETVNTVFESIMDDYDSNARLVCTIDETNPGLASELHIAAADVDAASEEDPEQQLILKLIRDSLGREIYDVKRDTTKAVEYRDIVVLSRSRASIGKLERFLNNEGIPAYGENSGGYFETVEIQVFVNLLKIIDNTRQDIPFISVMRCPVFEFDVKELAEIRIAFRDGSYYDAVKQYSKEGDNEELKTKICYMLDRIAYWKELKNTVTLEELVRILLYETGYFDYCSGLPSGEQRVSNLRLLVEKAGQFEQNNYSGLYGFVSYIEAMKQSNISIGEAKVLGENENVVRIMTVHKSKGLEFPVVILAGMGRTIRPKGVGTAASMHKDLTLGMPYVDTSEKWHRKTLLQRVIEAKKAKEEYEEEIRILYVAITRAMDRLLLVGKVKDMQKLEDVTGPGKSFLEMVYGPMKEAGENIYIYENNAEESCEAERLISHMRMTELFERKIPEDREKQQIINEKLSFSYPFVDAASVRSKYSVTELNKTDQSLSVDTVKNVEFMRPVFSEEKKRLSLAQIGTLMHLVMEKLDFRKALLEGDAYVKEVVSVLHEDGMIADDEMEYIKTENIIAFFETETGRRAAMADDLSKEREFIMMRKINGAKTIVQGIIDCYFEEEDGLVLIDYKNSRIGSEDDEKKIVQRYRGQLEIYKEALESACGKQVKETYLYLFDMKKFIQIEI